MNPEKTNIAIITARSGSKTLPDKNIRPLSGLPLMAWSIRAAIDSRLFNRIILSTDSEKYAETGRKYGAEVPWLRESPLATDDASSAEVVLDILERLREEGRHSDTFMLLQPTSPLRTPEDIIGAYSLMQGKKANAIIGVCRSGHSPLWSNTLPEDLSMDNFITPPAMAPRQMLPVYYRINGAIYLEKTDVFLQTGNFFPHGTYAYIMPRERSVDIDDEVDFLLAEALLRYQQP